MNIIVIIILVVVAIIIIRAITSAMNRPPQWPQQPQQPWPQQPGPQQPGSQVPPVGGMPGTPLQIEPAADGFWIHPIGLPVGSVIYYRYLVLGALQQATAMVETGGRLFIYTGQMPGDIVITHIAPPTRSSDSDPSWQWSQNTGGGTSTSATDYPTARPVQPDDTSGGGGDFGGSEGQSSPSQDAPSTPSGGYPSAY